VKQLNVGPLGFGAFLMALTAFVGLGVVGLSSLRTTPRPAARPAPPTAERAAPRAMEPPASPETPVASTDAEQRPKPATSLLFQVDVWRARAEGRLGEVDAARVMKDTMRVVRERLDGAGFAALTLEDLGENRFEILVPAERNADVERVIALATVLGDLQFRIEVLPDGRYGSDEGGGAYIRQRHRVWPGTEEEFDVYKEAEVRAWLDARTSGTAYVPSRKPFRVVPRKDIPTDVGVGAFGVIEDLEPSQRFDGSMLEHPGVSHGTRGEPVTVFEVRREHQAALREWTAKNVRLPMAIVMNGEILMAPTINSPLSDRIQVTLGSRSFTEAKQQAEELKVALRSGSLPARPTLVSRTQVGVGPAQPPR
jgi:preprotein translocase subunit SecD